MLNKEKHQAYLQRIHALCGFPPTFSDGWKNTSISLVFSLSKTVGSSGSESSYGDSSSVLGAASEVVTALAVILLHWNQIGN